MTNLRGRTLVLTVASAVILAACAKSEPDIPTFDPMDKIQIDEGWKVERAIAVSPGAEQPVPHHVQAIASGLHDIDFKSPPRAMTPVTPSCKVNRPDVNWGKYLIVGDGSAHFPLMNYADVPRLTTFTGETANAYAKKQADNMAEHGMRKTLLGSNLVVPGRGMSMKDVFITETSESVVVALAGGGLYNFHLAPNVRLKGVVVYTGITGYNKSSQAAVAGVPDDVPVTFISETHKATKGCWTKIQNRTDKTWNKRHLRKVKGTSRFEIFKPRWKAFQRRVRNDLGDLPDQNIISVSLAGHFLIGPAPTRYEDRIPYVAFGGKSIRYSATEFANFGTNDQNSTYAGKIVNQYYEAHMAAGTQ